MSRKRTEMTTEDGGKPPDIGHVQSGHAETSRRPTIKTKRIGAARVAVCQSMNDARETAYCLLAFTAFLEEAKPAEIRLLGDMLAEWQNWGGSLRAGNFFAGVARAVLDQDTEVQLKAWLQDRRRSGAHAREQERRGA